MSKGPELGEQERLAPSRGWVELPKVCENFRVLFLSVSLLTVASVTGELSAVMGLETVLAHVFILHSVSLHFCSKLSTGSDWGEGGGP